MVYFILEMLKNSVNTCIVIFNFNKSAVRNIYLYDADSTLQLLLSKIKNTVNEENLEI